MNETVSPDALIRPMVQADLALVLRWRNHPEVRRHMLSRHEITSDEHQRWFERSLQDSRRHLLIFELDRQPLGFVNFTELASAGIADWGFYAAPDAPRGSGQRLGQAALAHGFTQLKFHKVCAQVLAQNERSLRFHRALGFQQEGVLRDQHFDGVHYHHLVCFGLLRDEWPPGRPTQENPSCAKQ